MLPENLIDLLEQTIKKHWDIPALSDYQGKTLRYGEVAQEIERLHHIFRKSHLKKGDKIALLGKNSVNWSITYLATITYGAVIVPILPDFNGDDVHHIVTHSDSLFLFTSGTLYDKLDEAKMPGLGAIFSLDDFSLLYARKKHISQIAQKAAAHFAASDYEQLTPATLTFPESANADLASIVYTSGTTGFSKGVMISQNNLMANILFARKNMVLYPREKILSFLPSAHAYGCMFEFLFPFTMGCHITLLGKTPSPKVILQAFQELTPRLILSVPLVIEKIYNKQIKPVLQKTWVQWLMKCPPVQKMLYKKICRQLCDAFGGNFHEIVIGGASFNEEVEGFLKHIRFPFTIGYGMTECAPLISYAPWDTHRAASVGRAIDFLEVKVQSDDPCHVAGNILVRGENVMMGYYKNEQATREVLDEDGWLNTGDLGLFDKDGFIYIKGRSKNMLLGPSGQNIYPEEIEARLNNLPFVQESLVLEKNGRLYAQVYPDLELADAKHLSETQLAEKMETNRRLLNSRLPGYSSISKIQLYPREFEKTPTRKIKRFLYQG